MVNLVVQCFCLLDHLTLVGRLYILLVSCHFLFNTGSLSSLSCRAQRFKKDAVRCDSMYFRFSSIHRCIVNLLCSSLTTHFLRHLRTVKVKYRVGRKTGPFLTVNNFGEKWHTAMYNIANCSIFTMRLHVICCCNSVRPSVCMSDVCSVTKLNVGWYFDTTRYGIHCSVLTPTMVVGDAPFPLKSALKMTHPFEKHQSRRISARNVSTVRDSEKSSITTNTKLNTGFPTSYRWSAYITPKSGKGGSKSYFLVFWVKVNGWSSQALPT